MQCENISLNKTHFRTLLAKP